MRAMFELHRELAQIENNSTEIQILVSRQIARTEELAEKATDTTEAKAVLRGREQVLDYFDAQGERILFILT